MLVLVYNQNILGNGFLSLRLVRFISSFQGVFDVAGLVRDEDSQNNVVSCLARTTRTGSSDIMDFYPLFGMKSYGTFYIREGEYDVTLYTRMIHNVKANLGERLNKLLRTNKSMRTSLESLILLYTKMIETPLLPGLRVEFKFNSLNSLATIDINREVERVIWCFGIKMISFNHYDLRALWEYCLNFLKVVEIRGTNCKVPTYSILIDARYVKNHTFHNYVHK